MLVFLIIFLTGLAILTFLMIKFNISKAIIIYQLRNSLYKKYLTFNIFIKSFTEEDMKNFKEFALRNIEGNFFIPSLLFLRWENNGKNSKKFLAKIIRRPEELSGFYFVIYSRKFFLFKKFVGILFSDNNPFLRNGALKYWIDKEWEGKGIMTLACKHYMKIAFEHLRLKSLLIVTQDDNSRSIALAKKLGFKKILPRPEDGMETKIGLVEYYFKLKREEY